MPSSSSSSEVSGACPRLAGLLQNSVHYGAVSMVYILLVALGRCSLLTQFGPKLKEALQRLVSFGVVIILSILLVTLGRCLLLSQSDKRMIDD